MLLALLSTAVLLALAVAVLRPARDPRLQFSYATYRPGFWEGDCQCPAPVAAGDLLVFCGGYHWARKARLVAVDRRSQREVWRIDRPTGCGALRVIGTTLYLWDGHSLTAYSTAGAVQWTRLDVKGLPFEAGGATFVSARTTNAFVVVDPRDGATVDAIPLPEPPDQAPLVDSAGVSYGTPGGRLVTLRLRDRVVTVDTLATRILSPLARQGNRVVFHAEVADRPVVMAYDVTGDSVAWSVSTGIRSQWAPLVDGESVYFGSATRLHVARVGSDAVRHYDVGDDGPVGRPVMREGVLYLPVGRFLLALDPATGATLWRFAAGEWLNAPSTLGPPLVVDGVVYVGSLDCRVYGVRAGR